MHTQRLTVLLAFLLAASAAGNLALVLYRRAASAPIRPTPPAAAPATSAPTSRETELQAQLSKCQGAGLAILAAAMAGSSSAQPKFRPDAGAFRTAAPAPGPIVTPALEREALSNVALQHLRQEWERSRSSLIDFTKSATTDPNQRNAGFQRDLSELAVTLNLDDSQRAAFAARDAPLRDAHLNAVSAQLASPDPDFNRILEEARGFFADEDQLVNSIYGPASADLYRAAQLERRSTVLAILATLANQPWDERVDW